MVRQYHRPPSLHIMRNHERKLAVLYLLVLSGPLNRALFGDPLGLVVLLNVQFTDVKAPQRDHV